MICSGEVLERWKEDVSGWEKEEGGLVGLVIGWGVGEGHEEGWSGLQ